MFCIELAQARLSGESKSYWVGFCFYIVQILQRRKVKYAEIGSLVLVVVSAIKKRFLVKLNHKEMNTQSITKKNPSNT
jgi:hypothetical protein